MGRGEIWTASGGQDHAGKPRPVVILQDDNFDATSSITICAFTTDETDAPLFRYRSAQSGSACIPGVGGVLAGENANSTTLSKPDGGAAKAPVGSGPEYRRWPLPNEKNRFSCGNGSGLGG